MESTPNGCPGCGSTETTEQPVVEHRGCGCIRERSAFAGGCPKCGASEIGDAIRSVGTARYCPVCERVWQPVTAGDDTTGVGDNDALLDRIDLSPYRRQATDQNRWLSRLRTRLGSQSAAIVVLLAVVGVGLGGATVSTTLLAEGTAGSVAGADEPEWSSYETIVVFRNDDIQPWYRADARRAVDRVFIEEGVPVTLGVIPTVGDEAAPITDSEDTCEYLRSLRANHPDRFEIALHGYTHDQRTAFYTASEFGGVANDTQADWLARGTEILAACTGVRPRTFVPPMNTYDTGTVEAAADAEYRTVSGGSWFTDEYYNETGVFVAGGVVHAPQNASFVDWDRNRPHNQSTLRAAFDDAYDDNEIHIQMLHYQTFETEADRAELRSLIRYMKSTDTAFLTVGQLAVGLESGDIRETEDGWEIREPLPASTAPTPQRTAPDDRLPFVGFA